MNLDWLKELYEKLAFQKRYDFFKNLKWTAAQQELIDSIWANLGPTLQKALWSLVALILAKYGPQTAQSIFASVLSAMKKEGIDLEGTK